MLFETISRLGGEKGEGGPMPGGNFLDGEPLLADVFASRPSCFGDTREVGKCDRGQVVRDGWYSWGAARQLTQTKIAKVR